MKKQLSKGNKNIATTDVMKRLGAEYKSQKASTEESENQQVNYI